MAGDNFMKKKRLAAAALTSCLVLSATFTGCSLVSTNGNKDMEQIIATVDIRDSETFATEFKAAGYKDAIAESNINKRSLVSYFINTGYTYINNYNYTYEKTFNLLLDNLIDNAVLVQYSTLGLIKYKAAADGVSEESILSEYNSKESKSAKYEYLLGGENSEEVMLAKYNFYSSVNSAIDSNERTDIEEDEDGYKGTDTRTTPTNLNTEQEDYFPGREEGKLDYAIYTGYEGYLLGQSGAYKDDAIEGTTSATRIKAYNTFINNLMSNNLVDRKKEADKLTDVLKLEYMKNEYASQLESRIVNKYNDVYEEMMEKELTKDNYSYIKSFYEELLNGQKDDYKTASAFESAMGNLSDTSFLLYSPDTGDSDLFDGENHGKFGYVYNILLPFNAKQTVELAELTSKRNEDKDDNSYYYERNRILQNIYTEDQRQAWFNGSENYSFKAEDDKVYSGDTAGYFKGYDNDSNRQYLFFENNLTNNKEGGRYKKLKAYDGRYSYNGYVAENENGSYTLVGNKLNIDGMLNEFSAYINYVLGGERVSYVKAPAQSYYGITEFKDADDEIDYEKLMYASGKVNFGNFNADDLMNAVTEQYKAMSAVNELQFAYTTDTSVLSQYVGYSVSAYDTSYIKEFEYAAKKAISMGEGAFTVCAGDYGWHLIYVTYTFDGGDVYSPDWTKVDVKGSFENLFLENMKGKDLKDVSTTHRSIIVSDFKKENVSYKKYQKRYQNLLDLDKNSDNNDLENNGGSKT